ncbi:MAG: helix-turn-helix domain-containing protein, partial [Ruminococcus sp.]
MNLKKIRMEKGLTVQQLAELAGLPKRTVEETARRDTC